MVNDCKPMFLADIVSVNFIYRCQQRVVFAVFKAMFAKGVCMSLWCDLQASKGSRRSKKKVANLVFDILLYFRGRFVWHFIYRLYKALFSLKYTRPDTIF